ncbi:MAG: hypothetical protein QOF36_39 [Microbacteriaceae bacterium]|jgi:hypothetical protein|nr:hypothetical protein [Microbacteriaceae bacterium]
MTQNHVQDLGTSAPRAQPVAYRVPWLVSRGHAPLFRIINVGREQLWGVTLTLSGAAVMRASAPRQVRPGESLTVTIHGRQLERDTVLIVRWFRPSGEEYLWRVSF